MLEKIRAWLTPVLLAVIALLLYRLIDAVEDVADSIDDAVSVCGVTGRPHCGCMGSIDTALLPQSLHPPLAESGTLPKTRGGRPSRRRPPSIRTRFTQTSVCCSAISKASLTSTPR